MRASTTVTQLNQLDASRADAVTDVARSEIHPALRAGTRSVLADIDAALRSIEQGTCGRCHSCCDARSVDRPPAKCAR